MFCKFSKEKLENLQRYRVRTIEKRRGSPNAYNITEKTSTLSDAYLVFQC